MCAFDKTKLFCNQTGPGSGHVNVLVHLIYPQGDGGPCQNGALFMQLDDGGKDPAVVAFTAAAVKGFLLAFDEGGQGIGKVLVAARQDFERYEDLLEAGLKVRLKQVIGEIATL